MQNKKIYILLVEPMLYGIDRIHEVYEKTEYEYQYVYCTGKLTGKDNIVLPENAFVCHGSKKAHREQVVRALENFRPNLAVINGYVGAEQTAAIRYCQRHRIPYAIESDTPLHIPENRLKALAKKLYLKPLLHHPCCFGFPGGTLQRENLVYYGIPEEKNHIMPMSVSTERLLTVRETLPKRETLKEQLGFAGKTVFLFVGRLAEVKNVKLLIEAFAVIKKSAPDTALLIVGDGPERASLEKQTAELSVTDVFFAGYIVFPEIIRYYKAADVFVLPSTYEPWGLVVNEAMTMGLPVIVSDDVGCSEDLVKDGVNGFVFESDHADDLIRKMKTILAVGADRYAEEAKKTVAHWNYGYYLECFENAIKEILF